MLRKSVNPARDEVLSSGMIIKSLTRSLHEKCSGLLLVELVDAEAGSEWKGFWRAIAKGGGVVGLWGGGSKEEPSDGGLD